MRRCVPPLVFAVLLQRGHLGVREVGAVASIQRPALDHEGERGAARPHQLQLRNRRLWEGWQVGEKREKLCGWIAVERAAGGKEKKIQEAATLLHLGARVSVASRRFRPYVVCCCFFAFVCVFLVGRLLVQLGVWSCLSFVTVRDRCDRSGVVEVRVFTAEFLTQPELLVVTDKETTYLITLENKGPYRPQTVGSRHTLLTTPYLKGRAILNEATSLPP